MDFNSPEIYKIISENEKIAISAHVNPDGDAIGSCLAMGLALKMMGKKPTVFLEKYNPKFHFLSGNDLVANEPSDEIFDLFIALDCGSIDRLSNFQNSFNSAKITFNIDHHISNTNFADYNIVYPDSSSACEVVYEIIKNFCMINRDIAEALYTGILTDTNGFMHNSTSPRTHEIAAQLLKCGISSSDLHTRLLYTHSVSEMKVFGYAVSKAVVCGKICYSMLTKDEIINKCNANYTELDTIVSYLLNCENIEASAFIYEKEDGSLKASLRSSNADVSKIATKYGGGGHKMAAGVTLNMPMEDAKNLILGELKEIIK